MNTSCGASWTKKLSITTLAIIAAIVVYFYTAKTSVDIIDFEYARDAKDIHALFNTDWYWLVAASPQEYDVDLVLRYRVALSDPNSVGKLIIKVLQDAGDFKGFVAYYKKTSTRGFILFLSVKEDGRRKGYGEQLARYAMRELQQQGATTIELVTRPSNERALNLYTKKLGFKETSRDDNFVYLDWKP